MKPDVGEATLSSMGDMTVFSYGKWIIRFKTSPHLERYVGVNGFILIFGKTNTIM